MKGVAATMVDTIIKGKVFRNVTAILIRVYMYIGDFQWSGIQNSDINDRDCHQGKHHQQCD